MSVRIAALFLFLLTAVSCNPVPQAEEAQGSEESVMRVLTEAPRVGHLAPDFVLQTLDGREIRLSDYRGHVVFLNFWATWCGPCKVEIPAFVELYDRYKDKGLVIVGVSIDDSAAQLRPFMKEWRMQYPVLQMNEAIETAYGPFYGVPTTFFIGRDGTICRKHMGPATKEQFEREIRALL